MNKWTLQEIGNDNKACIMCNGVPVTVEAVVMKLNMQEDIREKTFREAEAMGEVKLFERNH